MLTPPFPLSISFWSSFSFSIILFAVLLSHGSERGAKAFTASRIHASVKGLWSSRPALFFFSASFWISTLVLPLLRRLSRTHSPVATSDNTHVAVLETEILFLPW